MIFLRLSFNLFLPTVLFCVVLVFLDFLHCLILFSYGFPWIFLWLPFSVCFPIVFLGYRMIFFALHVVSFVSLRFVVFLLLSHGFVLLRFSLVPLWLYLALLFGFLWFSWGPLTQKLNRNQETLEINGNHWKNKVSQDLRTIRTPPPPRTSRPPPNYSDPLIY